MVAELLLSLNQDHAWEAAVRRSDLQDYPTYRELVDAAARAAGVLSTSYKDVDKGLWVLAKYRGRLGKTPSARDDTWLVGQVAKLMGTP